MKSCTGTGTLPHDRIKYSSEKCPLCPELELVENLSRTILTLNKFHHSQIVKSSRRMFSVEDMMYLRLKYA